MPNTLAEHEKAVADAQAALDTAKQKAQRAADAEAEPRPIGNVLLDIQRWLISRAGNHPVAEKLLKELEAASGVTYDPESGEYTPIEKEPEAPAEPAKE